MTVDSENSRLVQMLAGRLPQRAWKRRPEVLLCAQTVKPMHGVVPRVILGQEWWDRTRRAAYASTMFHCVACGVFKFEAEEHQWLEGHELYQVDYAAGRQTYIETVPLCHWCHNYIHCGRLEALLEKNEITGKKYAAIMKHGRSVLRKARIKSLNPYKGPMADWSDWRLVLDGKEYPPLFKTYQEWKSHFSQGVVDAGD